MNEFIKQWDDLHYREINSTLKKIRGEGFMETLLKKTIKLGNQRGSYFFTLKNKQSCCCIKKSGKTGNKVFSSTSIINNFAL